MSKKRTWDALYTKSSALFGTQANKLAIEYEKLLPPNAKILNIGDGEGFNSLYFAQKQHKVTSLDNSKAAQSKAATNAAHANAEIEFVCQDILEWEKTDEKFDLISLFFVHVNGQEKKQLAANIINLLKPGGFLLFECFHVSHSGLSSTGPKDISLLYTEDQLRELYSKLDTLFVSINRTKTYMEGKGEQPGCTLQFVGLKNLNTSY